MIKNLPKGKAPVTSEFKTLQKINTILNKYNKYQKIGEESIFLLTRPSQSQELKCYRIENYRPLFFTQLQTFSTKYQQI